MFARPVSSGAPSSLGDRMGEHAKKALAGAETRAKGVLEPVISGLGLAIGN